MTWSPEGRDAPPALDREMRWEDKERRQWSKAKPITSQRRRSMRRRRRRSHHIASADKCSRHRRPRWQPLAALAAGLPIGRPASRAHTLGLDGRQILKPRARRACPRAGWVSLLLLEWLRNAVQPPGSMTYQRNLPTPGLPPPTGRRIQWSQRRSFAAVSLAAVSLAHLQ